MNLRAKKRVERTMAGDRSRAAVARQKRAKRLKKYIILTLMLLILILFTPYIVLLVKVHRINRVLAELETRTQELSERIAMQGQELERLAAESIVPVSGSAESGTTGSDLAEGDVTEPDEYPEQSGEADFGTVSDGNAEQASETEVRTGTEAGITASHKVYLTFDDGPSIYTDTILDILDEYDVKATFFVVGKETETAAEAMKEIVARGHTLGMHSYSHKYKEIYASLESFEEDFTEIRDLLYEVTGVESVVYRFPGGSSNTISRIDMSDFAEYLDTQGVRFFDWNISSGDGGREQLSVDTLVENATSRVEQHETAVILMHDSADKLTTVEALPTIIENILALDDTVILPITDDTEPVQHIHW